MSNNEAKVSKILNWLARQTANANPISVDVIRNHAGKDLHVGACLSSDTWDKLERRMLDAMNSTTVRTPPERRKKVAKANEMDALLRRAIVPKKWRPQTDREIETMLDGIPNTPMSKEKASRMLRKINGQEPVFANKPAKKAAKKKGARKQ